MLSAEEVKPLLLHEDSPVRDMAVDYFHDSWSQDPTLVPMILERVADTVSRRTSTA